MTMRTWSVLAEYFSPPRFDVEERDNGTAALSLRYWKIFDCFIFDVSMPGMSGLTAQKIRERGVQTAALFLRRTMRWNDKVAGFEAALTIIWPSHLVRAS